MIRLILAGLLTAVAVHAQAQKNYIFKLDNGVQVLYQTYSELTLNDQAAMFGSAESSGNSVRRTMVDKAKKPWLGFEIQVQPEWDKKPVRFRLSMAPLGGWRFFGRAANPREIGNGDRILLDVVEEPGTGRKVFDTFQVGIGVQMQVMPMPRSAPAIPRETAIIHLKTPTLTQRGIPLGQSDGSVSGGTVSLAMPGRRQISFSAQPSPGFRMEAIAEGHGIRFVVGNDTFDLDCSGPVLDATGASYIWVKEEASENSRSGVPGLELFRP